MIKLEDSHYLQLQDQYELGKLQVDTILATYGKNMEVSDFMLFLSKAKQYGLSIERWEIRWYKDNKQNIVMFAGRDWFLSLAHRDPRFSWLNSSEVCEKDKFELDIANQKIVHQHTWSDRWAIIWAYAIAYAKDSIPVIERVSISDYDKKSMVWNTHKSQMIKKVAEVHALKKQFGISWLYWTEEAESMWVPQNIQDWTEYLTEGSEEVQAIIKSIEQAESSSELDLVLAEIKKIKKQLSKTQSSDILLQRSKKKQELKNLSDNWKIIEWETI